VVGPDFAAADIDKEVPPRYIVESGVAPREPGTAPVNASLVVVGSDCLIWEEGTGLHLVSCVGVSFLTCFPLVGCAHGRAGRKCREDARRHSSGSQRGLWDLACKLVDVRMTRLVPMSSITVHLIVPHDGPFEVKVGQRRRPRCSRSRP
jgi:hypothetical protein